LGLGGGGEEKDELEEDGEGGNEDEEAKRALQPNVVDKYGGGRTRGLRRTRVVVLSVAAPAAGRGMVPVLGGCVIHGTSKRLVRGNDDAEAFPVQAIVQQQQHSQTHEERSIMTRRAPRRA
jgi:hypothetical protein